MAGRVQRMRQRQKSRREEVAPVDFFCGQSLERLPRSDSPGKAHHRADRDALAARSWSYAKPRRR